MTADALLELGISPYLVVEAAEEEAYKAANPDCKVIVWPQRFMDEYEKTPELDPHPTTGAAHNYAWEHSREMGYTHHWIMDDNIRRFVIRHKGRRAYVADAKALRFNEEFIQKFKNLAGIALAMSQFMQGKTIALNTRLYCAVLYRNDLDAYGIKWRRGLNDDTIVSLDILKTGYWCTAENRAVGILKLGTSRKGRIEGGMTDFYAQGGFIKKSAELVRLHPDCTKTVIRFNRIHHVVDFSQFKQQLIPVNPDDWNKKTLVKPQEAASRHKKTTTRDNTPKPTKRAKTSKTLQVGIDRLMELLETPGKKVTYPIYIPSKNRADNVTTAKLLKDSGVPFKILVEPQDVNKYLENYDVSELLVMDKNDGGIDYARNFAKEHSTQAGHQYHWQFDDDIRKFLFRKDGKNQRANPAEVINSIETVVNLYSNIGTAAAKYDTFAFAANSPITLNKMVASAMLFKNDPDVTFRPNIIDDIDITMQYLTKGYCSLVFSTSLVSLPTTPNDTGGMGKEARVGDKMRKRCENLVAQWGNDAFKVITKNGAPRIAPSRVWNTFPQQPQLKDSQK